MSIYRMRIPASVCVSIEADSEAEAIKICQTLVDEDEGQDIELGIDSDIDPGERVYIHAKLPADEIGVEDIEDDDETDSSIFAEEWTAEEILAREG